MANARTIGDGIGRKHLDMQKLKDSSDSSYSFDSPLSNTTKSFQKISCISALDLATAQKLGKSSSVPPHVALHQEKAELHKKSEQVMKTWTNTVLGQRKKRLEALKEKELKAEMERDRLDKEWAAIQSQERKEAIERAKMMMRLDSPRYKTLHSQLLLSQVVHERDLQKKHKENLQKKTPSQEKIEFPLIQTEIQEYKAHELARIGRLRIARDQIQQIHDKYNKEFTEKQSEFEKGVLENDRWSKELKETKQILAEKAKSKKANWKRELDAIIAGRHSKEDQERLEMESLNMSNARFEKRKLRISKRHKEYLHEQSQQKEDVYNRIAHIAYDENKLRDSQKDEFIQKGVQGHVHDASDRIEREAKRKEELKNEMLKIQESLVKRAKEKMEWEKLENAKYEKMIKDQDDAFNTQTKKERELKRQACEECKFEQLEQIKNNAAKAEELKKKKQLQHMAEKQEWDKEDADFVNYANELIQEWNQAGKDTRLISKSIKGHVHVPRESGRTVEGIKLDTFERLGFTARWLKEPVHYKNIK